MADGKTSFFNSTIAGITGSIKGLFAGGFVGAIAGATVGLAIAALTGGTAALAAGAAWGAAGGATLIGGLGATAGTITGVVKSREIDNQPSPADIVNVAKLSFAQGVTAGRTAELEETHSNFRERLAQQRKQQQTTQRIH